MITSDSMLMEFKDNIAFMTIFGKLSEEDMALALDWLKAETEAHDHFNMCITMKEMEWPSLDAVKVEFLRIGEILDMLEHIDKCAVVSDSGFVRTAAKIEGALFRGLTVKAFEMDEKGEALGWLGA